MKLTTVSVIVRRTIIGIIAFTIAFIIFKVIIVPATKNVYLSIFPPKDLPNTIYGKLDPVEFVERKVLGMGQTYELNTETGRLPTKLPKNVPVYKYKPIPIAHDAGKQATETAQFLGFDEQDLITDLKGNVYKWRDTQTGGTLEIEINTRSLNLTTNLAGKAPYYKAGTINKSDAIKIAKELFKKLNRFSDLLYQEGDQEVHLGKIHNGQPAETKSTAEAQFARVDFFREINKIPIVGTTYNEGLLSATVSQQDDREFLIPTLKYPNIHAYYWEIEPQTNATYPIVPVASAWEAVRKGSGVITSVIPEDSSPFKEYEAARVSKIIINDIYLAYYDGNKPQKYLQPIYVFTGNYAAGTGGGKIAIYFPAISGEYIKTPEKLNATPDL